MNILFIDTTAYKPYDVERAKTESLGGSEATMLRVANGLGAKHACYLYQGINSNRPAERIGNINHIGMDSEFPAPDLVVHFRMPTDIPLWKGLYPAAKHIMWMQDLGGDWLKDCHYDERTAIVCTSKFHAHQVTKELQANGLKAPAVTHVYNPVCAHYGDVLRAKVPHRLGFFSSPHKGLMEVLGHFEKLREVLPDAELVVGNPGYITGIPMEPPPGVRFLGDLPHRKAMNQLSECSLLFYPQTIFPEAFGIVMAEANALGVPVLAHRFGACKEVCQPEDAIIDCKDADNVLEHALTMLSKPATRQMHDAFKLDNVIAAWEAYLAKEVIPAQR